MTNFTNHDLTVGKHRATICEWIEKDDSRCDCEVVFGKPYCAEHYSRAYVTITAEEFKKETDSVINEVTTAEIIGEPLLDEVAEDDGI